MFTKPNLQTCNALFMNMYFVLYLYSLFKANNKNEMGYSWTFQDPVDTDALCEINDCGGGGDPCSESDLEEFVSDCEDVLDNPAIWGVSIHLHCNIVNIFMNLYLVFSFFCRSNVSIVF